MSISNAIHSDFGDDSAGLPAMPLKSRIYRAIIGMDILEKGTIKIERGSAIEFEF